MKTEDVNVMVEVVKIAEKGSRRCKYLDSEIQRLKKLARENRFVFRADLWEQIEVDPFWKEKEDAEKVKVWWRAKIAADRATDAIHKYKEIVGAEIQNTGGGCMVALVELSPGFIVTWNEDSIAVTVAKKEKTEAWDLFYAMGDEDGKIVGDFECCEWAKHPEVAK